MKISWTGFPNSVSMSRVLASVRHNPIAWSDAYRQVTQVTSFKESLALSNECEEHLFERLSNQGHIRLDLLEHLHTLTYDVTVRVTAWDALKALLAWDDCAYMLDSVPDELKLLVRLGDAKAYNLYGACVALSNNR